MTHKRKMHGGFFSEPAIQQRSFPTSATHNFYIFGVVENLPDYVDMITILDLASEDDIINIFLNTPGGCLNTTLSILHAMFRTKATVITHADGQCASAGTLLFLAGQYHIVYPYANFMFHDGVEGYGGKVNENLKMITATSNLLRRLTRDLYSYILSDETIESILEGRDLYLDSDEMLKLLKEAQEKIDKAIEDAIENEEKPVKAKRKSRKKKEPQLLTE